MCENLTKFVPFGSCVNPSFWHKLSLLKLDVDKLEEPVRQVWGYFSNVLPNGLNRILSVDCSSFNEIAEEGDLVAVGYIHNKNTLEGFTQVDKTKLLADEGKSLLELIKNEQALDNPKLLNRFTILCYADLKKHKFTYWFAFPAISVVTCRYNLAPKFAKEIFSSDELEDLAKLNRKITHFVLKASRKDGFKTYSLREGLSKITEGEEGWFLVCSDSTLDNLHPGWPLRNYLALYAFHCPHLLKYPVQLLCLRFSVENGKWSAGQSLVISARLSVAEGAWDNTDICTGWERNEKGNFGPRVADLYASISPLTLAETSVNLNLKLMKWQVLPDLNLDVIKEAKCLLLGAGTLGCVVARSLLGWGVQHITLVDNAIVSYSNPVRQSLYQFSDVGKPKAPTAAASLKAIHPAVTSEGIVMCIPMPGHPVGASLLKETKDNICRLDSLIQSHDVVFLLMDSRESRWLPTVIGAAHKKIVLNAALGFDSYLVMRHGTKAEVFNEYLEPNSIPGEQLGCYFCNDVTAPGNSGQARTLDQQCTVTRPGVSNVAGSLVVELMVSLLQHDARGCAPAYTKPRTESDCRLGVLPHSIRGFLHNFETILPAIPAFSSCVGCSAKVTKEYINRGINFVLDVLESKTYLEELTGLSDLHSDPQLEGALEMLSDEDES